jgi:hypothetical protein
MEILATLLSEDALEKELVKIQGSFQVENPVLALGHSTGSHLLIGISRDCSFAIYHNAQDEPPFYNSLGNRNLSLGVEDTVDFSMADRDTIMHRRYCISFEELLKVARQFFLTGLLPEGIIEWEV